MTKELVHHQHLMGQQSNLGVLVEITGKQLDEMNEACIMSWGVRSNSIHPLLTATCTCTRPFRLPPAATTFFCEEANTHDDHAICVRKAYGIFFVGHASQELLHNIWNFFYDTKAMK